MAATQHSATRRIIPAVFVLSLLLSTVLPGPTHAQLFPSQDETVDTIGSFWSFNADAYAGITGAAVGSSGNNGVFVPPTLDQNKGGITPVGTVFTFQAGLGAHYEILDGLNLGVIAGYDRRGTTAATIQIGRYAYQKLMIDYLTIGPRFTAKMDWLVYGVGFSYGLPLSATVSSEYGPEEIRNVDLMESEGFEFPASLNLEVLLSFPLITLDGQAITAGLAWDIAFNSLLELKERDEDDESAGLKTTSWHVGLGYSFGL